MSPDPHPVPRRIDSTLRELLGAFPAVMITGARATGKTTSALIHAAEALRLDVPATASVVAADVDLAITRRARPLLIDEWHLLPDVLGAVKRSADGGAPAGSFILTGSARADLDAPTWAGTGRIIRLALSGLTVAERTQRIDRPGWVDRLVDDGVEALLATPAGPDLSEYLDEIGRSGFPFPALRLDDGERRRWLSSYIEHVVTRDAEQVAPGRDAQRLARFLTAFAAVSAQVVDDATLVTAAGVDRRTAHAYEGLMIDLGIVDVLPAWWSNRIKRLTQRPKRLMSDAALMLTALALTPDDALEDGTLLGQVIETFVLSQLRAEVETSRTRHRLFHLRTQEGRQEVDLVIELRRGRVIGVEIKATSSPRADDARHLRWLRDRLGAAFVLGVVLHTGPHAFPLEDGIVAAPIASLWT